MMKPIAIKSYNGIGDLLFVTPTLRVIKESYPDAQIVVRTNRPQLLDGNPYVDNVSALRTRQTHKTDEDGIFLDYADPIHAKNPTKHHIIADWEMVTRFWGLSTATPRLRPEVYAVSASKSAHNGLIGVQTMHKAHWHAKKVWPHFEALARLPGFEPIPAAPDIRKLLQTISKYRMVVCAEGGISHIARALDTPAVVIMGGFHRPEWAGYVEHTNLVDEEIWCRDECYNPGPCKSKVIERECMRQWTVEEVEVIANG